MRKLKLENFTFNRQIPRPLVDLINYSFEDINEYEELTEIEKSIISKEWFETYTQKVKEYTTFDHCEISAGGTELISSKDCPIKELGTHFEYSGMLVPLCLSKDHTCHYFDKIVCDDRTFNIICVHPKFKQDSAFEL